MFLQKFTSGESPAAEWPAAEPVLALLKQSLVVVMLYALANVMLVLSTARKVFEQKGCKLTDLHANISTCRDRLKLLHQDKTSLGDFGGVHMDALRKLCPAVQHGRLPDKLQDRRYPWAIELTADNIAPDEVFNQLVNLVKGIDAELADRFPAGELELTQLFEIFNFRFYKGLPEDILQTAGEKELTELLLKLSNRDEGPGRVWCKEPLIDITNTATYDAVFAQFRCMREFLYKQVRSSVHSA